MKLSSLIVPCLASLALAQTNATAHNSTVPHENSKTTIVVTNDDSWASANIRAFYDALKKEGYNVFMFAPAVQQSGTGGTFNLPTNATLAKGAEWQTAPAGAPSWAHDEKDDHIWYFDGTPGAAVSFGFDYALPKFYPNTTVDLVVSGPNEGWKLGPFVYTLSGTEGAMYTSILRGVPAVAFSGNNDHTYYANASNSETSAHKIYAKASTAIVKNLLENAKGRPSVLPIGVGISVNLPNVGDIDPTGKCVDPKPIFTRQTGRGAATYKLIFNETSGVFDEDENLKTDALRACFNGDCFLPDETDVVTKWGCYSSISVITADYDAPGGVAAEVQYLNRNLVTFAPTGYGSFPGRK
ncbi:survival protein sure-like phosphatase/nucleotidase [Yarrowia lipolytica]|nr:survival protein sure-like phosphatase/nucleotidase [Yarrowia lipolytica]RDW53363.1 survival protein sure-like phosphatase/nucleotidase [Yarrowia lipolytica]